MSDRIQKPSSPVPVRLIVIVLSLLLVLFSQQTGLAQSTYGSVVGTLTDANNALVPGVQVKLTEIQTNISRETKTRDDGTYEFVNLTQGRYRIEAEKTGFAKFTTRDFELAARQTVRIDGQLSASGVSVEVQVIDAAPLINTENPTIVGTKSNRELQQLPFVFRVETTSPISAIAVLPEVQKGTANSYSLSGGQSFQNEVSVDGITTTSVRDNGIGQCLRRQYHSGGPHQPGQQGAARQVHSRAERRHEHQPLRLHQFDGVEPVRRPRGSQFQRATQYLRTFQLEEPG